jgi:hypothetical protein
MPNFTTNNNIILQPNDSGLEHQFKVTVSTSITANDGIIGYGRSVSSISITAHKDDGTSETGMLGAATLLANVITLPLSYPSGGVGRYHIRFVCTLDDGSKKELDFNRVEAKNL